MMTVLCALSVTVRLAVSTFVLGLVAGLMLGHDSAAAPAEPDRAPVSATVPAQA